MNRTPINPWPWSVALGYNQAELVTGTTRHLTCAGQTAVDATGAPQHRGDMRGQMALALDNLGQVLAGAGMGLSDVTRLVIYTTDVDACMGAFDLLGAQFGAAGARPPMTLLGVSRLALPGLMVEIEAQAAD
jgi:enamine deaminase RidA (YjgF/YER057c/UK114 family)